MEESDTAGVLHVRPPVSNQGLSALRRPRPFDARRIDRARDQAWDMLAGLGGQFRIVADHLQHGLEALDDPRPELGRGEDVEGVLADAP